MKQNIYSSKPQQISESAKLIAKKIFGDFSDQKLLIFGENRISSVILESLKKSGLNICKKLTEKNLFIKDIKKYLVEYDIIITALKSEVCFLKKSHLIEALKKRKYKPILLIDTNIPGNIESEISRIDNSFLFDLNDLEQFISHEEEKFKNIFLKKENDYYYDELDNLVPKFFNKLKLNSSQIYLLEDSLRNYFKISKKFDEKIGIINFLKFFLKK